MSDNVRYVYNTKRYTQCFLDCQYISPLKLREEKKEVVSMTYSYIVKHCGAVISGVCGTGAVGCTSQ